MATKLTESDMVPVDSKRQHMVEESSSTCFDQKNVPQERITTPQFPISRSSSFASLFPCISDEWGDLPLQFNDSEDMVVYGILGDAVSAGWVPSLSNAIYIEEEDYDRLRESTDMHDNFDQIGLAQKIEKHELLEMRRVSAYIYKKAGRWKQSTALSKKDNLYRDAMETASQSGQRELAEELLVYFIEKGKKECFASCLFICYDLIRPGVALELAWMNNMIDFSVPYLLQFIREYTSKVDELVKDKIEAQNEVKSKEQEEKNMVAQQNMYAQLLPPALPAPPGMGGAGLSGSFGSTSPMPGMMGMPGGMGMPPMPAYGMPPMGSY